MTKMTTILGALLAAVLMLAATATATKPAPDAKDIAKAQCKAEKKADKKAFKLTYGKGAMRTCVKGEKDNASETINNASEECTAEEEADPDAFAATYGTGKDGKNAHGKCVSSKIDDEIAEDTEEFANAAKECKSEKKADEDAFTAAYGTNKNGKNAFGKCVSAKVQEDDEETPEETPTV